MWRWVKAAVRMMVRTHLLMGLAVVGLVSVVISFQISNRFSFASSELHQSVMDRWGAPIQQPAPSVRYVASGSVFNSLTPLPLDKQAVTVKADMNYRKRGLVYFSGFDFAFLGEYEVENREKYPIDLVFVFPIQAHKNQVLLSALSFSVNGEPAPVNLSGQNNRLVWTGRAKPGERLHYQISFRGRGLESFVYQLDPSLRVNGFRFAFDVSGGGNYDYPSGVVPASTVTAHDGAASLTWEYGSLESGVPVGLILPSEKAFDSIIGTMVRRCWAPFIPFLLAIVCLGFFHRKPLRSWQSALISAWYGLFFVLLAYLAAFLDFYLAFGLSLLVHGAPFYLYVRALISKEAATQALGASAAFLLLPSVAVILQGFTGLLYTLEIAVGLACLMIFTTREAFRQLLERLLDLTLPSEIPHAS